MERARLTAAEGTICGRMRRLSAALLLALAVGCGKPPPMAQLALVSVRPVVEAEILAHDVEAEWCFTENLISVTLRPPWRARLADHGKAIGLAIDRVPGADVLLNVDTYVRVEQYGLFQRICAQVVGDAGKLP